MFTDVSSVIVMTRVSHAGNAHFESSNAGILRFYPLKGSFVAYTDGMDAIDHKIIGELRHNARANYGDIGDIVGLSASAVKRRVDKMVADDTIRGFTVLVDPTVEGLAVEAYVELFCQGTVSPTDLRRILLGVPEVIDAGTVSGDADAIVHLRAKDIGALEDALERVRIAPNVNHTKSSIVLSNLIHRPRD